MPRFQFALGKSTTSNDVAHDGAGAAQARGSSHRSGDECRITYSPVTRVPASAFDAMVSKYADADLRAFGAWVREHAVLDGMYRIPLCMDFPQALYEMLNTQCVIHHPDPERDDRPMQLVSVTSHSLVLPRFLGVGIFGVPDNVRLVAGLSISERASFAGTLVDTPPQETIVAYTTDRLRDPSSGGGAALQAPTGTGKTVMLIYLICQLQVKCMWISTRAILNKQSAQRMEQFAPDLVTHQLTGSAKSMAKAMAADVVMATPQLLSRLDMLPEGLVEQIGLVVVDEAHLAATHEFVKGYRHVRPRYFVAVSATMRRNDHLFDAVPLYFGPVACTLSRAWAGFTVRKRTMRYDGFPANDCPTTEYTWGVYKGRVNYNEYLKFISEYAPRNQCICEDIRDLVDREGRTVYVCATWVRHLEILRATYHALTGQESGLLVGRVKGEKQRAEAIDNRVIFTTFALGSFGVDVKGVDTIMSVAPFSRSAEVMAEQLVGRIRPGPNKKPPVLVDYIDKGSLGYSMFAKRSAEYLGRLGCTIDLERSRAVNLPYWTPPMVRAETMSDTTP